MRRCFVVSGEKSGDQQAAPVVAALRSAYPSLSIEGVGGPYLEQVGLRPFLPFSSFQVMGLSDVLRSLPWQWTAFRRIRTALLADPPDLLLLVDYPGFNLRLAKSLRKKGYRGRIVYYICPKVWAWGRGRIEEMARDLDLLLPIFPFEPTLFSETSLPCHYVGHPLLKTIANYAYDSAWRKKIGIPEELPLLSLFPGSRRGEIIRNFPVMLEAVAQESEGACVACSVGEASHKNLLEQLYAQSSLAQKQPPYFVPYLYRYELMRESRFAVAKAGTVNLELALHQTPTIVTYVLTRLNKWFAQYILRLHLPHYSMVNILLEREVFPELIARGCSKEMLIEAIRMLDRESCRRECNELIGSLEEKDVGEEALHAIRRIL